MHYCSNCGKRIKNGNQFCPFCGSKQINVSSNPSYELNISKKNTLKSNKPSSENWIWLFIGYVLPLLLNDYQLLVRSTGVGLWFYDFLNANQMIPGLYGTVGFIQLIIAITLIIKFRKQHANAIRYLSIILLIMAVLIMIFAIQLSD